MRYVTYLGMGAGTGQAMHRIITARRGVEVLVEAIFDGESTSVFNLF